MRNAVRWAATNGLEELRTEPARSAQGAFSLPRSGLRAFSLRNFRARILILDCHQVNSPRAVGHRDEAALRRIRQTRRPCAAHPERAGMERQATEKPLARRLVELDSRLVRQRRDD